ncbi:uncharacterized protein EDB91DRAFT_1077859 [Suillus paluster]|uniref:uncharacterized protein n=1 Tax=Suillus paluster TaxID=48578 RepID=UPI001B886E15|nr:uncharacterized protein EDB91DRAFT_1077859 [Suillus paluster]KAG1752472.1 hypothetical protein EDB91DRAFT_1077859 [Suillus paluster]
MFILPISFAVDWTVPLQFPATSPLPPNHFPLVQVTSKAPSDLDPHKNVIHLRLLSTFLSRGVNCAMPRQGVPPTDDDDLIRDEDYVPPPSPYPNSQPLPAGKITAGEHGRGILANFTCRLWHAFLSTLTFVDYYLVFYCIRIASSTSEALTPYRRMTHQRRGWVMVQTFKRYYTLEAHRYLIEVNEVKLLAVTSCQTLYDSRNSVKLQYIIELGAERLMPVHPRLPTIIVVECLRALRETRPSASSFELDVLQRFPSSLCGDVLSKVIHLRTCTPETASAFPHTWSNYSQNATHIGPFYCVDETQDLLCVIFQGNELNDICFLTKEKILSLSTDGHIELYDIEDLSKIPRLQARSILPVHKGFGLLHRVIPVTWPNTSLIFVISARIFYIPLAWFDATSKDGLSVPWSSWGPQNSRHFCGEGMRSLGVGGSRVIRAVPVAGRNDSSFRLPMSDFNPSAMARGIGKVIREPTITSDVQMPRGGSRRGFRCIPLGNTTGRGEDGDSYPTDNCVSNEAYNLPRYTSLS